MCNYFLLLISHNLSFLCGFIFLLILYPLFLLFWKVSKLIIKCFITSHVLLVTKQEIFVLKLPQVLTWSSYPPYPLRVRIHIWFQIVCDLRLLKVSSNFNILTQFVVEVIDLPSSLSLLCSLLRERKLSIGKSKLSANWLSCLNIGISLSNLLPQWLLYQSSWPDLSF